MTSGIISAGGFEESLAARFERQARTTPDQIALRSERGQATYAELNAAANRLAHRLLERGGQQQDRIAVLMRHDGPLIAAVLAVLKAGRAVVVLNPSDPAARLKQVLDDADPAVLVSDDSQRGRAEEIAGRLPILSAAEGNANDGDPRLVVNPHDLAILIYTSGSTGRPKAVMQNHRNFLHNTHRISTRLSLNSHDRHTLLASLSGGQGMATTLAALLTGATLCPYALMEKGVAGLADWLEEHAITVYVSAASVFRNFMKTLPPDRRFAQVRIVRLGAETANADDFRAFRQHFSDACTLVHTLSSSETGSFMYALLRRDTAVSEGPLPLGSAADDIETLVVDEQDREVGPGGSGELVVRSRYLSPGYWRNPALTAERFKHAAEPGGLGTFRGGDLARRRADGALVYAGRKDARVKINGYRVELFEVECALREHPAVEQVVVGTRPRPNDELQLVGYVVPRSGQTATTQMLRRDLRRTLPGHMVPSGFVFLETLPYTPNGKVDRTKLAQLPLAETQAAGPFPRTDTELRLAELWCTVFEREQVGRDDDFFALGGDSLLGAVLAARVHTVFGVQLDLGVFASHPTLGELAALIDARRDMPPETPPLTRADRGGPLPLSFAQERTWKFSRTPEASAGYVSAATYRLCGTLDAPLFHRCLRETVARHEVLRTTFAELDGAPRQIIHEAAPDCVEFVDLATAVDPHAAARQLLRAEAAWPFDLAILPLVRLSLVRLGPEEHWLIRVGHHIVLDSWSWRRFFDEFTELYETRLRGDEPPARPTPLQFADYAVWQRRVLAPDGPRYQRDLAWWQQQLAGRPQAPALPFQRAVPAANAPVADGTIRWGVAAPVGAALDRLARQHGATFYVIRLAAFGALLADACGQSDLVLGNYVTNRLHEATQNMFGFFVNLTTLRIRFARGLTFHDWVGQIKQLVADTQSHSEIPYEQLGEELRRGGVEPPEIRLLFTTSGHSHRMRFGNVEATSIDRAKETMPWGFVMQHDPEHEQHHCSTQFDARLYDPVGVRAFIDRYQRLLAAVTAHPDIPLGRLLTLIDMSPHSRPRAA